MLFDNRRHPPCRGARAAGPEAPRLRFRAGGAEVDLELDDRAGPGQLRLFGQVTAAPADLSPAQAVLDGPAGRAEAGVDDLGQFVLDGLAHGRHRLEIVLAGATAEIPDLEL